jgi:hypothetical protein
VGTAVVAPGTDKSNVLGEHVLLAVKDLPSSSGRDVGNGVVRTPLGPTSAILLGVVEWDGLTIFRDPEEGSPEVDGRSERQAYYTGN